MKRMIAYGFWKSWRTRRIFLLICLVASVLLIPATGTLTSLRWDRALAFCYPALFVISMMLMIAPFIWAVADYNRGISGTRGVLERAVAVPAWQKLMAKLITSLATIVVLSLLGLAILAGTAAVAVNNYATLGDMWRTFIHNPDTLPIVGYLLRGGAWGFAIGIFGMIRLLLLIWFGLTLIRSFPGSRKAGVLITVLVFAAYAVVSPLLSQLAEKVPLYTFTLYTPPQGLQSIIQANMGGTISSMTVSLSTLILRLAVTVLAFCGTAWLMDHRVEG